MARFGKPDYTGRSSGKLSGRDGKRMRPPKDEPWVWKTRELLRSAAWRSLSINSHRFIDFLLVEHMNHAGTMNGALMATHRQLQAAGLHGPSINLAILDAEAAGLVKASRGGMRVATTFRLTFYPSADGTPATNEWKGLTASMIEKQKSALRTEGSLPTKAKAERRRLPTKAKAEPAYETEGPSIFPVGVGAGGQRKAKRNTPVPVRRESLARLAANIEQQIFTANKVSPDHERD